MSETLTRAAVVELLRQCRLRGCVCLGDLGGVEDEAARALAAHRGELDAGGLAALGGSPGQLALARRLAGQGEVLNLRNLRSLSPEAARVLARHKGILHLGLRSVDDETAAGLATTTGFLYLPEVESLGDSDAHLALAKTMAEEGSGAFLCGLTSLGDAAARVLSGCKGDLYFGDLRGLSEAAARALAAHKGDLFVGDLPGVTEEVLRVLAGHKGYLFLGLTTLGAGAARALAGHEGELQLGGLTSLSEEEACALAAHKGEVLVGGDEDGPLEYGAPGKAVPAAVFACPPDCSACLNAGALFKRGGRHQ